MTKRIPGPLPEDLVDLRHRIDAWRLVKKGPSCRMPEGLWGDAADLAQRYGVSRVAGYLGLGYKDLSTRSGATTGQVTPKRTATLLGGGQLGDLRLRIGAWRTTKPSPATHMPEDLWNAAVSAARGYGLRQTASACGLGYAVLQARVLLAQDLADGVVPSKQGWIPLPDSVTQLRQRIATWRASKTSRNSHMPSELWDQSVALAKDFGISRVALATGLPYVGLSAKVARCSDRSSPTPVTATLTPDLYSDNLLPFNAVATIDLSRPDGSRIQIQAAPGSSADSFAGVVAAFLNNPTTAP